MESIRLQQLWAPYTPPGEQAQDEWARLIARWSEPHRGYHNLEHLLLMLELLAAQDAEPATMLAAWYHDAIYDPRSETNEADSAELAAESLTALGLGEIAGRVSDLIMLTAGHHDAPDEQAALLLDADLAILGQPPAIYLRYVNGVRHEFAHIDDDGFRSGRAAILNDLLQRDALYRHPAFTHLEKPARANLAAELSLYEPAES